MQKADVVTGSRAELECLNTLGHGIGVNAVTRPPRGTTPDYTPYLSDGCDSASKGQCWRRWGCGKQMMSRGRGLNRNASPLWDRVSVTMR